MIIAPKTWLSQVFMSMIRPQSCTATKLFILTTPVSMSTKTSAICTPPTPAVVSVPVPGCLPRVVIGCVPSFAHASFQVMLFEGSSISRILPPTASSLSGAVFIAGATFSNSAASASTALPGVNRKSESAFDGLRAARSAFAARTPEFFPFNHLGGLHQFVAVDIGAGTGLIDILQEEVERIHLQFGGQIIKRRHRDQA